MRSSSCRRGGVADRPGPRRHGQGRYTLRTGDAGLALYLWHCLDAKSTLPALDAVWAQV